MMVVAAAAPTQAAPHGSCSSYRRHISSEIRFHSLTRRKMISALPFPPVGLNKSNSGTKTSAEGENGSAEVISKSLNAEGSSDACLRDFALFKFHAGVKSLFCTLLLEYISR